jgi:hypothetical protein
MSSMDDKTKLAIKTRVQQLEDNHRDELQHLIEQQTLALTNLIVQLQEKVPSIIMYVISDSGDRASPLSRCQTCSQNIRIKSAISN